MNKNRPARPVDEGIDPSNEKIILDQIKVPAEEKQLPRKKKSAPELESTK